jgi:hypothetical protein
VVPGGGYPDIVFIKMGGRIASEKISLYLSFLSDCPGKTDIKIIATKTEGEK